MDAGIVIAGIAALALLAGRKGKAKPPPQGPYDLWSHENLISAIQQTAEFEEIPIWLPLAVAEVESGILAHSPEGSGPGRRFYPFGITAAQGSVTSGFQVGTPELEAALSDPGGNVTNGVARLVDLWTSYGPDHERVRVAWIDEGVGRKGPPYPEVVGGQDRQEILRQWNLAVQRYGGPWRGMV